MTSPTPVHRLSAVESAYSCRGALWVKRDDLFTTHAIKGYGGNKARRIGFVLPDLLKSRPEVVLTFGGPGSHHVLATALALRPYGVAVKVLTVPQSWSKHAEDVFRTSLGLGVDFAQLAFGGWHHAPLKWMTRLPLQRTVIVPPGGSNRQSTKAYFVAAQELAAQIQAEEIPVPAVIVVALGSGGTAAGLRAGLDRAGLGHVELIGANVSPGPWGGLYARWLTRAAGGSNSIHVDDSKLSGGYGKQVLGGAALTAAARCDGVDLDATYTEKALSVAVDQAKQGRTTLYWHTLASDADHHALFVKWASHEVKDLTGWFR